MTPQKIKLWYWILIGEFVFVSFIFLTFSFFAEPLGIDSGGNWGLGRKLFAVIGFILGLIPAILLLSGIRRFVLNDRMAKFTRYTLKAAAWVLVMLVFFELILQAAVMRNPVMSYEQDWGVVPIAGATRFLGSEGYGITHYLSHGEEATPFDDGDISVVVLGDSFTEALQVLDIEKFVSQAELELRSDGQMVNLHNMGKSGNCIPDYIYFAPIIEQYYNPEIIVVQLNPQDFEAEGDAFKPNRQNHFVVNGNGDLEIHHENRTAKTALYQKLISRIILVSYGWQRWHLLTDGINESLNPDDQLSSSLESNNPIHPEIKYDEQLHLLQEAYPGVDVIILVLPYSPKFDGNSLVFIDVEYQKLLESAKRVDGFYIIDPKSELDRVAEEGALPRGFNNSVPGSGHFNTIGHGILGKLLAGKILEILH